MLRFILDRGGGRGGGGGGDSVRVSVYDSRKNLQFRLLSTRPAPNKKAYI